MWPAAASATRRVPVNVRDQLLDTPHVVREESPRVSRFHALVAPDVADDPDERLRVQPREPRDVAAELYRVGRRGLTVQPHHRPEEDHDGALARLEQLELAAAV